MSVTVAVVLCAGSGVRAGRPVNKVFLQVAGRSILERSVRPFYDHPAVHEVFVVAAPSEIGACSDILRRAGIEVAAVLAGGVTRHQSESHAVDHLSPRIEAGDVDMVLIHDGARPLFDPAGIGDLIAAARRSGGAISALPATEDLLVASGREVVGWLARDRCWRALTPQVFRADLLLEAFRAAARDGFGGTDTASTVERIGGRVEVVSGDPRNLKVTFPEDFVTAERLASE